MSGASSVVRLARAVARRGDPWCERMGIDLFGIRAAQQAQQAPADYAAALTVIAQARDTIGQAWKQNNKVVTDMQPAFDAQPDPAPAAGVQDVVRELKALQPKLKLAKTIISAAADIDDALARNAQRIEDRAGYYLTNVTDLAFPGLDGAVSEFKKAKALKADAIKRGQFGLAAQAMKDIQTHAAKITEPYDTYFKDEKNKDVFAKADRILSGDPLPAAVLTFKGSYESEAAAYRSEWTTRDYSAAAKSLQRKVEAARSVIMASYAGTADDWLATARKDKQESDRLDTLMAFSGIPASVLTDKYQTARADGLDLALKPSEVMAIVAYTGSAFEAVNDTLRRAAAVAATRKRQSAGKALTAEEKQMLAEEAALDGTQKALRKTLALVIEAACDGLDKLPSYDPTGFPLFRWEKPYKSADGAIDVLEQRYKPGTTFTIEEFWSSGAGAGADVSSGYTAEIVIFGQPKSRAKAIASLSAQRTEGGRADKAQLKGQGVGEVLFPPGTKFKAVGFHRFEPGDSPALDRAKNKNALEYRIEVMELP